MQSTQKFTGRADGYARHRPRYAGEYIDYLATAAGLSGASMVADIGSGTGILTGQLLGRGFTVLAVEPNADMRAVAERQLAPYAGFQSIAGAAEDTTLEAGSVDLVVAGQAFHWFDKDRFKVECRRILKKGGKVALVWNIRDHTDRLVLENEEICKRFCPDFVGFSGGILSDPGVFTGFFRNGAFEYRAFQNDERYDLEGLIGRTLSGSYAPREGDGNYMPFVESLREWFRRRSVGGTVVLPSATCSYLGEI